MPRPSSKLPFVFDAHDQYIGDDDGIMVTDLEVYTTHADVQYIIHACNEYPTAIEMLSMAAESLRMAGYDSSIVIRRYLDSIGE